MPDESRCCFNPYSGDKYWDKYCSKGTHNYAVEESRCDNVNKPFVYGGSKKTRKNKKSKRVHRTRRNKL